MLLIKHRNEFYLTCDDKLMGNDIGIFATPSQIIISELKDNVFPDIPYDEDNFKKVLASTDTHLINKCGKLDRDKIQTLITESEVSIKYTTMYSELSKSIDESIIRDKNFKLGLNIGYFMNSDKKISIQELQGILHAYQVKCQIVYGDGTVPSADHWLYGEFADDNPEIKSILNTYGIYEVTIEPHMDREWDGLGEPHFIPAIDADGFIKINSLRII